MTAENTVSRRFYGRRWGRPLRAGRKRLLKELLPTIRIEMGEGQLSAGDLATGNAVRCWLEIGFGGGEHLAAQAKEFPEISIIGCEPFINGVARLLSEIESKGLRNVRIYPDDARDLIDRIPSAIFEKVFLLFPDPWPKKRHLSRRYISIENLDALARVMRDGGEFRFASDDMEYVRWTLRYVRQHGAFEWTAKTAQDWLERPSDWPATRYELKALADGRSCIYLRFRRRKRA